MSLHDVDTTTGSRTNPTVSTDDKVVSPMAHKTISNTYAPSGNHTAKDILNFDIENQTSNSSNFLTYKIIHSGYVPVVACRNATITLDATTNIGYELYIALNIGLLPTETLSGYKLLTNICSMMSKTPINESGTYYNNGTNIVIYKFESGYLWNSGQLYVRYAIRCTAGTFDFNPTTSGFSTGIYWQLADTAYSTIGGQGNVEIGDGKYYYSDKVTYNPDGSVAVALMSATKEFTNGSWAYFPN